MTTLVINPSKQEISFQLPTTYSDGTTPLPAASIIGIKISVGNTPGGPYTKSIEDTDLTPDTSGICHYPMASLGVDLTKPTYAVLLTDITGAESVASNEVGFQNLVPNPPSAVSAD
ncbi:MAG: hypothetical protein JWO52_3478 [Gammaproteobacteria bacterium]|nr:hypothetical protein [Gammaproteobacteria bacterium]